MRPQRVEEAHIRAQQFGFEMSCDDGTGRLLAVLAAAVRKGGRILEIGTGVGVGTAWLGEGLGPRTDVELVTIELEAEQSTAAEAAGWPSYVDFRIGDALEIIGEVGTFDLIFPDAPAGKWTGLNKTFAALRPGGTLIVDDMIPKPDFPDDWKSYLQHTREKIFANEELVSVEIADLTGVILSTKRLT